MTPEQDKMLKEIHASLRGEGSGLYAVLTVVRRIESLLKRVATKLGV